METSDHRTANSMHVFSSDTVKRGGRRRSRSYSLVKKVTRPPIYLVNQKRWRFLRRFFSSHTKKHRRLFRRKKTTVSPSPPSDSFFESITRPKEKISSLKRCIDSISLFILSISRLSISRKRKRRKGKSWKGPKKEKEIFDRCRHSKVYFRCYRWPARWLLRSFPSFPWHPEKLSKPFTGQVAR